MSPFASFAGNRRRSRVPPRRLQVEVLEERTVLSFLAAPSYSTGLTPLRVVAADFNGDGMLDLAAISSVPSSPLHAPNAVQVLLGNGDGTFQAVRSTDLLIAPNSLAVGDFDGDGHADLVLTDPGGVRVLMGNGDGSFQSPRLYSVPDPGDIVVADFNGDGHLDLAVTTFTTPASVSILLGNGDGTFTIGQAQALVELPQALAVGDFNRDGHPDLVVAAQNSVGILVGNGDGTFQSVRSYADGNGSTNWVHQTLAVGDFNGDGSLDLAVADVYDGIGYHNNVSILDGNGDGTFQPVRLIPTRDAPFYLVAADFNGDGHLDLAVDGAYGLSILLGQGDGTFQPPLADYQNGGALAVGDFNGDGRMDLAIAGGDVSVFDVPGTGKISILLGNGDGTLQDPLRNYEVGANASSLVTGDFNGDGIVDLAVVNQGSAPDYTGSVSILLGKGDGTFGAAQNYAVGMAPWSVAAGDVNGDGILDLIVATHGSNTVSLLLGNGDGTFQDPQNLAVGANPDFVTVADLNRDGHLDIIVLDYRADFQGGVTILLGNGDGTFQAAQDYPVGKNPVSVAVADFNGDGAPDLIVADYGFTSMAGLQAGTALLLGNGDGTFEAARFTPSPYTQKSAVAVGDFNGDGKMDYVTSDYEPGFPPRGFNYYYQMVYLGNGDGTFQPGRSYGAFSTGTAIAVVDLNGDGISDLVTADGGFGSWSTVSIYLGKGDGTFQAPVGYVVAEEPRSLAVADFNGDGYPDVAVTSTVNPGKVHLLLNAADWGSGGHAARPTGHSRGRRGQGPSVILPMDRVPGELASLIPVTASFAPTQPSPLLLPAELPLPTETTPNLRARGTTRLVQDAVFADWVDPLRGPVVFVP